ncbi:dolichyl-P-Man:Man(5)GlcNAc(2)-PP-dolichol alpha-1,3-mannosyltransferase [Dinochytrium kinnereticum]|nr:dolichyl-P-Man:Man(5)GlcNAc(2)-PP-dolichol alpha-1,3-mannosyltransferase [Dinochytrium kinnereticum]
MSLKNALIVALVAVEATLCLGIIWKVKYTEIDWRAYMQEVGGFMAGERDYAKLSGDTGPLVYPAGFVYVFSFLSSITSAGKDIQLAQLIFALLSVLTTVTVSLLYRQSKMVPLVALIATVLSKRMHSIFVLRLFNDPVAMLLLYVCILAMCRGRWTLAAVIYSLALSIKMNILLFAPGFALLTYEAVGLYRSIRNAIVAVAIQAGLGLPFLLNSPWSYLSRAFEFSRIFMFQWTVNWRFVPEEVFVGRPFAVFLLACHLATLGYFVFFKWYR